ncbi:LacI family DNA-binding transcriptional regulator [Paralimibaculum aggregatum]|uniref:LacI family DNA-binding transcriptional regulator n=1 Tax=Paralimibaculum aggregatum TaxID=3036245 RepID=A0ABQ6LSU8_9RHOB|nr:LacI family DNA-binding transcriptional regulator [Limibaculum sp. NKW23]GMG85144.1 LacI family DNA-binding transcriptional regulator [Limibaculum sp. NKW23]
MRSRPTLEDVARAAGVSTATVSRVVNTPDRVRAETRQRVEAAVAELGYAPHFGGRALASNRTGTVGAVIPTMENAIFARGLQAMQEELDAAGVTLLVATSDYDAAKEAHQIQTLLGRGVDGLVLIGEARDPAVYELLERFEVPFVLVWTWRADSPWPCVGFDNFAAARDLAERVLDRGHRRIAMVAGVTRDNDRAEARIRGVRAAMEARGLALAPSAVVECDYRIEPGIEAARGLLAAVPRPTVLICGNDVLAAGACRAVRAAGLRVPEDVSVTGFDNIEIAELLEPPLATVHVPHRRMGRMAARNLLARLDPAAGGACGAERPASLRLETEFLARGSLGPAP